MEVKTITNMEKKTRQKYQQLKGVFCSIRSVTELCTLLQIDRRKLELLCQQPGYKAFKIAKKSGGERLIEAPGHDLKKVLGRLNKYLQAVYFFEKSSAAYGFILGVRNDDDRRNVLTNAKKHVKRPFLLNVDLKDFFHAVTQKRVEEIFASPPFNFPRELPLLLADLVCYENRLPMGTPTSPVLSNLACRKLDEELTELAANMFWVYTRYADDLTFSSQKPINEEMILAVINTVKEQGFVVNQRKIQLAGPKDPKIVTGLLVSDEVSLAPGYLLMLEREVQQLHEVIRAQNEQGQLSTHWVEQLKQQVRGRLNFAGFVLKRQHPEYIKLKDAFYVAINPPQEEFGAMSWRGFPYNM